MYLVGLEEYCVLQALFAKSDAEFSQVLLPTGIINGSGKYRELANQPVYSPDLAISDYHLF